MCKKDAKRVIMKQEKSNKIRKKMVGYEKNKKSQAKHKKNEGLFLIAKKAPKSLKNRRGKTARTHITN